MTNELGESRTETRKQQKAIHGDVGRDEGGGEGGGLEGEEGERRQRGMGAGEGVRGVEQGIKLCQVEDHIMDPLSIHSLKMRLS